MSHPPSLRRLTFNFVWTPHCGSCKPSLSEPPCSCSAMCQFAIAIRTPSFRKDAMKTFCMCRTAGCCVWIEQLRFWESRFHNRIGYSTRSAGSGSGAGICVVAGWLLPPDTPSHRPRASPGFFLTLLPGTNL